MISCSTLVPDPLCSDRQYERFYHLDIVDLGESELREELWALQSMVWWLSPGQEKDWLRERVRMLERELAKRRGNINYKLTEQPKPQLAEGVQLE